MSSSSNSNSVSQRPEPTQDNGVPNEPPPPYTEVADPLTERTAEANYQRPYAALNQSQSNPPPPGPPPGPPTAQGSYSPGFSSGSFSPAPQPGTHYYPPPPPRPQQPYSPPSSASPPLPPRRPDEKSNRPPSSSSTYPGNRANTYGAATASSSAYPPPPPVERPQVPWVYPPNYWCPKCHNTGRKLKNGKSCQDCYARFARQHVPVVHQIPLFGSGFLSRGPSTTVIGNGPSVVVQPGDPRIGGTLCGRCRGRGLIYDFLGDYTCPTCKGVGRLF